MHDTIMIVIYSSWCKGIQIGSHMQDINADGKYCHVYSENTVW